MERKILIRFGDLMLKGRNQKTFVNQMVENIKYKFKDMHVKFQKQHDRMYISYMVKDEQCIEEKLLEISGIASYSKVLEAELNIEDIVLKSCMLIDQTCDKDIPTRFKIETKRANKRFPLTSLETTQKIAPLILKQSNAKLIVDVSHPEDILTVEIRNESVYIFIKKHKGLKGYPAFSGDKALLLISGGIDSPVAAFYALRQGIEVELFHFESSPLTPLESAQKVIDLSKVLSKYTPKERIKLHFVPFTEIHQSILSNVPEPYTITIMRCMMYQMAERFALNNGMHALVNGESVGQVASQTLQSLRAVEAVTRLPIIRPLITAEKEDIIQAAKNIKTFDISIRPFNDCCSIYVPKSPATKPRDYIAKRYESLAPFDTLMENSLQQVMSIDITPNLDLELSFYGFEVSTSLSSYLKEKSEVI